VVLYRPNSTVSKRFQLALKSISVDSVTVKRSQFSRHERSRAARTIGEESSRCTVRSIPNNDLVGPLDVLKYYDHIIISTADELVDSLRGHSTVENRHSSAHIDSEG